jgi:hypothetical protein
LAGSPRGKSEISGIGRRRKDYIKTDMLHGFSRYKLVCVFSRYSPVTKLGEHGNKVRFQILTAASMMFRVVFSDDGGSTHL